MSHLSDITAYALMKARQEDLHREAEQRRLAAIAQQDQNRVSVWHKIATFFGRVLQDSSQWEVMEHTEETLYQAEMLDLSPEELRLQEIKRRLYERIAQGNALAEAEYLAQRMH